LDFSCCGLNCIHHSRSIVGMGDGVVAGFEIDVASFHLHFPVSHVAMLFQEEFIMIVIQNFKEAFHLYELGRIPFRLLQEQAIVLINLYSFPDVFESFDVGDDDIAMLLQQDEVEEDYNGMLGGEVHVCESEEDLKQILGMDMEFARTHGNRWPDVTDQVMSWDQCDYLKEKDGNSQWAVFLLCWNDAGGPVFYVPRKLWEAAKVAEHVEETNRHWG